MPKFEYMVFNFSDLSKDKKAPRENWLQRLNKLGRQGWEFVHKPTQGSFLLKREVSEVVPDSVPEGSSKIVGSESSDEGKKIC